MSIRFEAILVLATVHFERMLVKRKNLLSFFLCFLTFLFAVKSFGADLDRTLVERANKQWKHLLKDSKFKDHQEILNALSKLLEEGADPNLNTSKSRRALHFAVTRGYEDLVLLLLKHGADPNLPTKKGFYPIHLASMLKHEYICNVLAIYGARINQLDYKQRSPLLLAGSMTVANTLRILGGSAIGGSRRFKYESRFQTSSEYSMVERREVFWGDGSNPDKRLRLLRKLGRELTEEDELSALRDFLYKRVVFYYYSAFAPHQYEPTESECPRLPEEIYRYISLIVAELIDQESFDSAE